MQLFLRRSLAAHIAERHGTLHYYTLYNEITALTYFASFSFSLSFVFLLTFSLLLFRRRKRTKQGESVKNSSLLAAMCNTARCDLFALTNISQSFFMHQKVALQDKSSRCLLHLLDKIPRVRAAKMLLILLKNHRELIRSTRKTGPCPWRSTQFVEHRHSLLCASTF